MENELNWVDFEVGKAATTYLIRLRFEVFGLDDFFFTIGLAEVVNLIFTNLF